MDKTDRYLHHETGAAWDVTAAIYERDEAEEIALLRSGQDRLHPHERRFLHDLGIWCERAVHLQCAGGSDTLAYTWQKGSDKLKCLLSMKSFKL